jgi:RNA polymerase sigma-70 factor (ECF subfamily)
MSAATLDALLERLGSGDDLPAGELFKAYSPYLRPVVRGRLHGKLQAKFDSVDVVQSVWVDLVRGFRRGDWRFDTAAQLRAFLIKATRNRFLNRVCRHRRSLAREQPMPAAGATEPASDEPPPSQAVWAEDLRQRILAACPPAHHELRRLKRQGLSLDEVVARTGLHPSSVRRILFELARRVAAAAKS